MTKEQWNWRMKASILMITITMLAFILLWAKGCGPTKKIIVEQDSPAQTCDDQTLGSVRTSECQNGYEGTIAEVCTAEGWQEKVNNCKPAKPDPGACDDKVTWKDIEPIINRTCVSCHFAPENYGEYAVSKSKIDSFIDRVNYGTDNPLRMPRVPKAELKTSEKILLEQWKEDGLLENCDGQQTGEIPRTLDMDYLNRWMLQDLQRISRDDQAFTRYLITAHRFNLDDQDWDRYPETMNKALNSIQVREDDLFPLQAVDPAGSIWRYDIRAYGIDRAEYELLLRQEPINIVDDTDAGQVLRVLAATDQPWLHYDNAINTLNEAALYYFLTGVPKTFNELLDKIGCNYENELATGEALMLGFNGSRISIQKNRLLSRHECDEGFAWVTYDPIDINGVPERNLFEFPLLVETGGKAIFNFDASEVIWQLPNGLMGYALFNAAGQLQEAAPLNVVVDTDGLDPEINNALDCHRCHAQGIVPSFDEVAQHVRTHASEFDVGDVELILGVGPDNPGLFREGGAAFVADNATVFDAFAELGIDPQLDDPINLAVDKLRLDYDLSEVAAFLFLPPEQFARLLEQSAQARAQVGQLTTGGMITFNQLVEVLPILIQDLRLFRD